MKIPQVVKMNAYEAFVHLSYMNDYQMEQKKKFDLERALSRMK